MLDFDALLCPDCGGFLDARYGPPCTCTCKDCEADEPHVCPKLMYLAYITDRDVRHV